MSNDKISVVVPCYNLEKYIEKSVQSILEQTYENIEIILVNDGSKDHTGSLIDLLAEKYACVKAYHQENGGVTKARLTGVRKASGEWIGFVDGDDYIDPDMYERLMKNAHLHQAQISHCGYKMVFPSRIDYYYNTGRVVEQDKETGLRDLLAGYFVEPGLCNKLFRRELFEALLQSGKMDDSIKNMEDLLMNYYLFSEADTMIYEDFCPYHYMVRTGSAATSNMNIHKLQDPMRVFRKIEAETEGRNVLQKEARRRLGALLIMRATMPVKGQKDLILPVKKAAQKELKERRKEFLSCIPTRKGQLLYLWAAYLPAVYEMVHTVYGIVTGVDKKFEVK